MLVSAGSALVPFSSTHIGSRHGGPEPWTTHRQSMSWRCPLSHAQTKRIGVTSLLRPSSNWNLRRPLLSRSCQRTNRRRRVVLVPVVFVSTCSQINQVGNIGVATPRGTPSRESTDEGGVRNERCAAGSRRPWAFRSCSRRIVRRGSGIVV